MSLQKKLKSFVVAKKANKPKATAKKLRKFKINCETNYIYRFQYYKGKNKVYFSICDGNGNQKTNPKGCRDILIDDTAGYLCDINKTNAVPLLHLLVFCSPTSSQSEISNFEHRMINAVKVINLLEDRFNITKSELFKANHESTNCAWVIKLFDERWRKAPQMISLMTWLVRLMVAKYKRGLKTYNEFFEWLCSLDDLNLDGDEDANYLANFEDCDLSEDNTWDFYENDVSIYNKAVRPHLYTLLKNIDVIFNASWIDYWLEYEEYDNEYYPIDGSDVGIVAFFEGCCSVQEVWKAYKTFKKISKGKSICNEA